MSPLGTPLKEGAREVRHPNVKVTRSCLEGGGGGIHAIHDHLCPSMEFLPQEGVVTRMSLAHALDASSNRDGATPN